eukprot:scaffold13647_cov112-Isochrysis_galbana.AAC.3
MPPFGTSTSADRCSGGDRPPAGAAPAALRNLNGRRCGVSRHRNRPPDHHNFTAGAGAAEAPARVERVFVLQFTMHS